MDINEFLQAVESLKRKLDNPKSINEMLDGPLRFLRIAFTKKSVFLDDNGKLVQLRWDVWERVWEMIL